MNAARRKALKTIITSLEKLDALRAEIYEALEDVKCEEEEALENMPESLQESDRGQQMQEYIDSMDEALDTLDVDIEGLMDTLQEIIYG